MKRPSIEEWLVSELSLEYQFSETTTRAWIHNQEVAPLLDGLDEVAEQYRADCVRAINEFIKQFDAVDIVVCSRTDEYEALDSRLRLKCAIILQPLTRQQIDEYLSKGPHQSKAMRAALREYSDLGEFLQTPLMLDMMSRLPVEVEATTGTYEERRNRLFDTYIRYMLDVHRKPERVREVRRENQQTADRRVLRWSWRQRPDEGYESQRMVKWLSWLARMMNRHSQSTFFLEQIEPSWLETTVQQRSYKNALSLTAALFSVLLTIPVGWNVVVFFRDPQFTWSGLTTLLLVLSGLALCVSWPLWVRLTALRDISVRDAATWSWSGAILTGLLILMMFPFWVGTVVILMVISAMVDPSIMWREWLAETWPFLLWVVPIMLVFVATLGGTVRHGGDLGNLSNLSIRRQARNTVVVAMLAAVVVAAGSYAVYFVAVKLGPRTLSDLPLIMTPPAIGLLGLLTGIAVAYFLGAFNYLTHAVLRYTLYRYGRMPLNYPDFLAYASQLMFLREVGGGYVFHHRLLQDHFAAIED
jgi:hypothetical protein